MNPKIPLRAYGEAGVKPTGALTFGKGGTFPKGLRFYSDRFTTSSPNTPLPAPPPRCVGPPSPFLRQEGEGNAKCILPFSCSIQENLSDRRANEGLRTSLRRPLVRGAGLPKASLRGLTGSEILFIPRGFGGAGTLTSGKESIFVPETILPSSLRRATSLYTREAYVCALRIFCTAFKIFSRMEEKAKVCEIVSPSP